MFRMPVCLLALLTLTTACEIDSHGARHDLQSASALHADDDGPLYRVEATFIGAERRGDIEALLNTLTVELSDATPDEVAERHQRAVERLAEDGGEGIIIEIQPLRPEDQGLTFGYTLEYLDQRAAPMPEGAPLADGLMSTAQPLTLRSGQVRVHDLWCYVFRVQYRTNSGQGVYGVGGPLGYVPLPVAPNGHWMELAFTVPSPWPYPWFAMVQNPYRQTLDYDLRVSCWG